MRIVRFLLHCLLLGVPVLAMLVGYSLLQAHFFPPPHFTNNLSLNEKLVAFEELGGRDAEVVAIGSSMTFNNLSSEEVLARFGQRYFNLGAWGLDMVQVNALSRSMVPRSKARTVIVVSNLMDFNRDAKRSSIDLAAVDVRKDLSASAANYLTSPALTYYLRQTETNRIRYSDRGNYECLMMDAHGGVVLEVPPDKILAGRWAIPPPAPGDLDDAQYQALEGLGAWLRQLGIRLIFIQSPYRDGVRTEDSDALTASHVIRIRAMLEPMDHVVIDATARSWPDSLFCDSSHLNGNAVHTFTRYVLELLALKDGQSTGG